MTEALDGARQMAVLTSGGVDSAILVADQSRQGDVVQPIYVRFGLSWERAEEGHLRRFLDALPPDRAPLPLVVLELPIADTYGAHWSVSGAGVPGEDTADSAVYLPGRNLLLLAKSSIWCALHGLDVIALGTLKGNPFSDSGPDFFDTFGALVGLGLGTKLSVETPFAELSKVEVLERGRDLALEHTFSCIRPADGLHCGRCNKCAERRRAFVASNMDDRTRYADA
jgi:7-cyano-7-deazaguanine synthase